MKRAFTLVELMIAVAIVVMLSGSGMVYLNNFNQWQRLESLKAEMVSKLRLAVNYAKTRQTTSSYAGTLQYVQWQVDASGILVAGVNGVGSTYFSQTLNQNGTRVRPVTLYFWGGDGHLARDVGGTAYGAGETATVYVGISNGISGYYPLSINTLGGVSVGTLVVGRSGP